MRNTKTSNGYGGHVNLEYLWKEKVKVWRNWINTTAWGRDNRGGGGSFV